MEMVLLMIQDVFLAGLPGLTEAKAASIRLVMDDDEGEEVDAEQGQVAWCGAQPSRRRR